MMLELPIPAQFKELFKDWAEGRIDFVEFVDGDADGGRGATDRSLRSVFWFWGLGFLEHGEVAV